VRESACVREDNNAESTSKWVAKGSVLQYASVCCSVLQCVAVCCSAMQCVVARNSLADREAYLHLFLFFFLVARTQM